MKKLITIALMLFLSSQLIAQTSVKTDQVFDIKSERASIRFTVQSSDYTTIDQRGATWSQSHNPTVTYYKSPAAGNAQSPKGAAIFSGLRPSTLYYVRAFVILNDGTVVYGNELSFKTAAATKENSSPSNTGQKKESKSDQPKK